ncbi:GspE/PulE family protein [Sporichthya sp.]|uniref:GspE/PulE family protein n=1 Tax=Sporichthya sp. TaxID=65475 RepID=UPI0017B415DE|nr:GspE/PulE family protein [Sporichthya sp.]MBA3742295.1 type II/IV secretion system protein [Sporichthya sp.]
MRTRWWPGSSAGTDGGPAEVIGVLGRAAGLVTIGSDISPVEIVEGLVEHALADRASDIHIEPQEHRVRVRYRVDGVLHEVLQMPLDLSFGVVSRIKVLGGMDIVEKRRPQDGQFVFRTTDSRGERTVDVRVSVTLGVNGEKVVLRLLESDRRRVRYSDLGMHPETARAWAVAAGNTSGMLLCAGPTGSGKTTTLYATLGELDDVGSNLCSIEDPVEYVVDTVTQIQINPAIGTTFASGLRSLLRQDPDVILVGEIRDPETAKIAVQSALTGHLVLSTVHARDSVSALYRFLEMGVEPYLVTSSVLVVMAQRLLRRNCPRCLRAVEPTPEQRALYLRHGGIPKSEFLAGAGCNACGGTGFHDRVGVYEMLRMTPSIRALVADNANADVVRFEAVAEGMQTLTTEAVRLVAEDVTTLAEVMRVVAAD